MKTITTVLFMFLFIHNAKAAAPMKFLDDAIGGIEKNYEAKCEETSRSKCRGSEYCTYRVRFKCSTSGDDAAFRVKAVVGKMSDGLGEKKESREHLKKLEIRF